jgi:hypothetical protein
VTNIIVAFAGNGSIPNYPCRQEKSNASDSIINP